MPVRLPACLACTVTLAVVASGAAHAATLALAGGSGGQVDVATVTLAWDTAQPFRASEVWRITGRLELDAGALRARRSEGHGPRTIAMLGATPVIRAEWPARAWSPFVELGAGINLLSHTELQPARVFSTAFQFGELGGGGVRFGPAGAYELGLRVQHISNGGIRQPNDGITFVVVRLACQFP